MLTDKEIEGLVDECFDSLKEISRINKEMNEASRSFLKEPALADILLKYVNISDDLENHLNDPDMVTLTESKEGTQLIEIAKKLVTRHKNAERIISQLTTNKMLKGLDKWTVITIIGILKHAMDNKKSNEEGIIELDIAYSLTKIIKMRLEDITQDFLKTFSGIDVHSISSDRFH